MSDKLLPIGSVVRLADDPQSYLIVGYYPEDDDYSYDYLGALYPQGFMQTPQVSMFDADAIDGILFEGYLDEGGRQVVAAAAELANARAEANQEIMRTFVEYAQKNPEIIDELLAELDAEEALEGAAESKGDGATSYSID